MYRNNVETGGSLITANNNSSDFPKSENNFLTSLEVDRFAVSRAKAVIAPRQDIIKLGNPNFNEDMEGLESGNI